jgi:hypothetical protein
MVDESISTLGISGWYSDCDEGFCSGNFRPTSELVEIDQSGATCYVNPAVDGRRKHVTWFGPNVERPDLLSAHSLLLPGSADGYLPTNCTADGVCDCGPIEPLRMGWRNRTNYCQHDTVFACSMYLFLGVPPQQATDCFAKLSLSVTVTSENTGTTIDFCPLNMALASTLSTAPSSAPSATDVSAAAATSASGILVWAVLLGLWTLRQAY